MHISSTGLKLIKKWEGCYLKAYKDCVGVWTIGYGITDADRKITHTKIRSGLKITQGTADAWLEDCIKAIYEPKVNKYMSKYNWNQNQYDALVSFCYNIGNIDGLTDYGTRSNKQIASKILEYCKAGGRYVKGLYERRKDEHALFCKAPGEPAKKTPKQESKTKTEDYDMPIIKKGSKGKAVKVWQVIIGANVDGDFGSKTESLTKQFQEKHKLTADGIVGMYTWSAGLGTL
jgi:GH24 family phage-related lysozyme (muramidase)